jgi:hypothetical protein
MLFDSFLFDSLIRSGNFRVYVSLVIISSSFVRSAHSVSAKHAFPVRRKRYANPQTSSQIMGFLFAIPQTSICILFCSINSRTVSLADTINGDGPTKAVISSYCHNLRLLVGIEIFILLFAVPNSEPSSYRD